MMNEIALFGEVHEGQSISISRRVQVKCSVCGWSGRRVQQNCGVYESCKRCGGKVSDERQYEGIPAKTEQEDEYAKI